MASRKLTLSISNYSYHLQKII